MEQTGLLPAPGDHRDQAPEADVSHRKRIRYQKNPHVKHPSTEQSCYYYHDFSYNYDNDNTVTINNNSSKYPISGLSCTMHSAKHFTDTFSFRYLTSHDFDTVKSSPL